MPNVGYATLQVIPSVQGISSAIQSQLVGPMQQAGQQAGAGAGSGILSGLSGTLKAGMAGVALAAGALFAKGLTDSLDQGKISGKLKATLGATPAEAGQYGKVAGKLYSSAVSDTFADAAAAIKGVVSQGLLPPGATNTQLQSIATKASDVATIMDEDLGRTTAAVSTIMRTGLAPNAEAAMDLLTRGVQTGANKAEDLLDTFTEYPVTFAKLGLDGQTAMGLVSQGLKAGARDSDFLADALKEFGIRAIDGSKTSAAGFEALGLSAQGMTAQIAKGGPAASAGLQTVLDRLKAMKDPVAQNAAAVALFGTKAEDLGRSLFALDPASAVATLGQVSGAAAGLGDALRDNAGVKLDQFKRGLEQGLTEFIGGQVLPGLERASTVLSTVFGPAASTAGAALRDTLGPAARELGQWIGETALPALERFGTYLSVNLGPAAATVGGLLATYLVPPARALAEAAVWAAPVLLAVGEVLGGVLLTAAAAVGRVLIEGVIPGFASLLGWIDANRSSLGIIAGVIGVVLLPILVSLGVAMAVAGAQAVWASAVAVAGWVAQGVAAVVNAALTAAAWVLIGLEAVINAGKAVVASWAMVAGWVAQGAAAVFNAAIIVGAWLLMGTQALIQAGKSVLAAGLVVGGWVAAAAAAVANAAIIVGAWLLMGTQALIQAGKSVLAAGLVVGGWVAAAAAAVANAAIIVGGWLLMGTQALIQGARMAAAWVLAMGPVGWAIALIASVAAAIFFNWDAIVAATRAAWTLVKDVTVGAAQATLGWIRDNWPLLLAILTGPIGLAALGIVRHWDSITAGAKAAFSQVRDWAVWLYENGVKAPFDLIGSKISAVTGAIPGAFQTAKDAVGAIWSGLQEVAAAPVRFVVNTVYNDGIRRVWNFIASKVGLPQLEAVPGFAFGGVYPGYTPGRDIGLAAVSGGEAVMRPEWTRAVGPGYVDRMNAAARSGGVSGVQSALGAPFMGGFGLGGIIGSAVDKAKGAIKKIPGVSDALDFMGDIVRGGLVKAAELGLKPIRGLINMMPGSPDWAFAVQKAPLKWIEGLLEKLKGEDATAAAATGGANVQSALAWAKTQAGKPYQWGGGGNPSWDCSGFMAAIQQVILGKQPGRLWTTFDFSGSQAPAGWKQNSDAPFRVGVTNAGVGHMAGTLGGVNVESRGGNGVLVGPAARGWNDGLFQANYGFEPSRGGGGGAAPTGQLLDWINQALAATGTPPPNTLAAWQSGMATPVGRESGGNPRAINTTDSNARAGMASRGLAQVIPPTFAAYRVPSLSSDIFNEISNLASAVNYIKARYGDISNVQQANPNLPPKGYDAGGWLVPGGTAALNRTGRPEAVLTAGQWSTMQQLAANRNQADVQVRVFLGDREITDIVRTEVDAREGALARQLTAGRR